MNIRKITDGLAWPEGPAILPDGSVAFVETYRSRISVVAEDAPPVVLGETGGGPNAVQLGVDGNLYCCQNGGVVGPWRAEQQRRPSIQQVSLDTGRVEEVVTTASGLPLRAPNDLAFGPDGRLYFTDPGGTYDPKARPDPGRIIVFTPGGEAEVLIELPPVYPNGIVVDADGSVIWVESYTGAVKRLRDGVVTEVCTLPNGHVPDGLAIAADGSLYVTSVTSGGLDVVRADGSIQGSVAVGDVPTNCCFAGSTLFVTDGGRPGDSTEAYPNGALWAIDVGVAGLPLFG